MPHQVQAPDLVTTLPDGTVARIREQERR